MELSQKPVLSEENLKILLKQAHNLYLQNKLKAAKKLFIRLNSYCPENSIPYFFLALLSEDDQNYQLKNYNQCVNLQPKTFHSIAYCKIAYMSYARNEIEHAYFKARESDPQILQKQEKYEQYMSRLEWAQLLQSYKRYDSLVIEILEEEHQKNPANPRLYLVWGQNFVLKNQYQQAKQKYEEGLEIDPNFGLLQNQYSFVLNQLGMHDKALEMALTCEQIMPQNHTVYNNKGNAFIKLGKFQDAVKSYYQAIKINPNFPTAYMNITYPLTKLGEFNEAMTVLERLLKIIYDTNDLQKIYFVIGELQFKQKQYANAIQSYKKSLEIYDGQPRVQYCVGMCHIKLHQFQEAVEYFQNCIDIEPKFIYAYTQIGYIFIIQKKYEEAILNYSKALQFKHDDSNIYLNIAHCKMQQKKYREALESQVKACEIKGDLVKEIKNENMKNTVERVFKIKERYQLNKNILNCQLLELKGHSLWKKLFRKEINLELASFLAK